MASRFHRFLGEIRRRKVFRAALVYIGGAFVALQAADILVPALRLPPATMTLVVVLVAIGFFVMLAIAWNFDLGRGGLQRTPPAVPPIAVEPGTVAVMPFLNFSSDPENDYFADGITEDVIAHLSKIRSLRVISRTSVMPFRHRGQSLREIAAQLGASTVVDGSVRRVGDRVRIVAEVIEASTDRHLWAETYDREMTDIFAIQTDVALHIANALEAELSPDERSRIRREPTHSIEAYELYLKARQLHIQYTPDSLRRAIRVYQDAIAADANYALAYASMALAYAELGEAGAVRPELARRAAVDAATQAVRIDPNLGEAHTAIAHVKALWEFDWAGALAGFRRAIELSPSSADAYDLYGRLCSALGSFDEAIALQRRAQQLDPLAHRLDVATTLLRAGRYEEAESETRHAMSFDADYDRAHATLGWALIGQRRESEGVAELERAVEAAPASSQWLGQLAQAKAVSGDRDGAREILARMERGKGFDYVPPYHLAYVYTGLGEHDRAIDLLERAMQERAGAVYAIKGSFLFAPLRGHPRYQALLARMNLDDVTASVGSLTP